MLQSTYRILNAAQSGLPAQHGRLKLDAFVVEGVDDYIGKKYVTCISFVYLGIISKKTAKKIFFVFFKIFHF